MLEICLLERSYSIKGKIIALAKSNTNSMFFMKLLPKLSKPFAIIIAVNGRFMKKLKAINTGDTSYQYLNSFNEFIKDLISVNEKLSRFLYPYVFIAVILGFWFGDIGGNIPGKEFVSKLIVDYPDMQLVLGLPLIGIFGATFIIFILALFGGLIGTWDINLVYSGVIKKLEELIGDMEELRN